MSLSKAAITSDVTALSLLLPPLIFTPRLPCPAGAEWTNTYTHQTAGPHRRRGSDSAAYCQTSGTAHSQTVLYVGEWSELQAVIEKNKWYHIVTLSHKHWIPYWSLVSKTILFFLIMWFRNAPRGQLGVWRSAVRCSTWRIQQRFTSAPVCGMAQC